MLPKLAVPEMNSNINKIPVCQSFLT